MPEYSKWSLFLRISHQNAVCTSLLSPYVLHAPLISFFGLITLIIFDEEYRSLSSSLKLNNPYTAEVISTFKIQIGYEI
jgi:hypothetical protein